MTFLSATAAGSPFVSWGIVVVPDGEGINTPSHSDGGDWYTPEQNVLAFGAIRIADNDLTAGPLSLNIEGSTKTMRKLKQGDVLSFISLCDIAAGAFVDGVVQFFFKT